MHVLFVIIAATAVCLTCLVTVIRSPLSCRHTELLTAGLLQWASSTSQQHVLGVAVQKRPLSHLPALLEQLGTASGRVVQLGGLHGLPVADHAAASDVHLRQPAGARRASPGRLAAALEVQSRYTVGVACAVHSGGTRSVGELPLIKTMLPSFTRSAETAYVYRVYVAYDVADPVYGTDTARAAVERAFVHAVEVEAARRWHPPHYTNRTVDSTTLIATLQWVSALLRRAQACILCQCAAQLARDTTASRWRATTRASPRGRRTTPRCRRTLMAPTTCCAPTTTPNCPSGLGGRLCLSATCCPGSLCPTWGSWVPRATRGPHTYSRTTSRTELTLRCMARTIPAHLQLGE